MRALIISVTVSMLTMPTQTANPGEDIKNLFFAQNNADTNIPGGVNSDNSPSDVSDMKICFRGRRGEECDYFFITENGFTPILMQNDSPGKYKSKLLVWTYELGLMKNLQGNRSIGGSLFFVLDDHGYRWAAKLRYRRWIGRQSIDISSGVFFKVHDESYIARFPSFTGHVGLNYHDIAILTLQLEAIRYKSIPYYRNPSPGNEGTDVTLYGGLKFGSYASIATVTLSLATLVIAYAMAGGEVDIGL